MVHIIVYTLFARKYIALGGDLSPWFPKCTEVPLAPAPPGKVLAVAGEGVMGRDVSPLQLITLPTAQSVHLRSLPFADRKYHRL